MFYTIRSIDERYSNGMELQKSIGYHLTSYFHVLLTYWYLTYPKRIVVLPKV